jgi:hypothetical protein
MRIYDPRLGKFLNIDPIERIILAKPYSFAGNANKVFDLHGAEEQKYWYNYDFFI